MIRVAAALLLAAASTGCKDFVEPEQTIYLLTRIDDKPLPVRLDGTQGTTATVTYGVLTGASNGTTCEFYLQVESGANIYRPKGSVPQCSIEEGGEILIRIDLGSPLVAESHDYLFQY